MNWDHQFEQLSRGRFQGRLQFADFNGVQLFDCEMNQVILCRGGRLRDAFTFSPVQSSNAGAFWRGRLLTPGMINAVACKYGFHHPGNFADDHRRQFGELPSDWFNQYRAACLQVR